MSNNVAAVIGDFDAMHNSFDAFDRFIQNRSRSEESEEEIISEEFEEVIEEVYEEEEEEEDSASSYYEEEIIDEPAHDPTDPLHDPSLSVEPLRLDTVHEDDACLESESESDALWEDVSESFHCDTVSSSYRSQTVSESFRSEKSTRSNSQKSGANSQRSGTEKSPGVSNSDSNDMVTLVRNLLNNRVDEGSMEDGGDDSSLDDDLGDSSKGGSSSVLPMDFDMGSYDGMPDSSDEESEEPEDYEEACREMIAIVHPKLDPKTMLHGCDLRNLYSNLKHQYRHVLKNPRKDIHSPEPVEEQPAIIEDDDEVDEPTESSASNFVEMSFSESRFGDIMSPQPVVNNLKIDANKIPSAVQSSYLPQIDNHVDSNQFDTTAPPKVVKWFHRNADDPEDFEYACRLLCAHMYDPNDPDYDVDRMLQRSSAEDLYRYLKPHYWFLAHSNQLDEDGVYISNETFEEEEQPNDGNADTAMSDVEQAPVNSVDALRTFFANRTETSEQSETTKDEMNEETTENDFEMHEEETSEHFEESVVTDESEIEEDVSESYEDASENNEDARRDFQKELEEESITMEEASQPSQGTSDQHSGTSFITDGSTNFSFTERDESSVDNFSTSISASISTLTNGNEHSGEKHGHSLGTEEIMQQQAVANSQDDNTRRIRNIGSDDNNDSRSLGEPPGHILTDNTLNRNCVSSSTEGKTLAHLSGEEKHNVDASEENGIADAPGEDVITFDEPSTAVPIDNAGESSVSVGVDPIQNNRNGSAESAETFQSSVYSVEVIADMNDPCDNEPTNDMDETTDTAHDGADMNDPCDGEPTNDVDENNEGSCDEDADSDDEPVNDIDERNEAGGNDNAENDKPSDDKPIDENVRRRKNVIELSFSTGTESSVNSSDEEVDMNKPCNDQPSDNIDESDDNADDEEVDMKEPSNDEPIVAVNESNEPVRPTKNMIELSFSTGTESSVNSSGEEVDMDKPCNDQPTDNIDESNDLGEKTSKRLNENGDSNEDFKADNDIQISSDDRNEGVEGWSDEIDESLNDSHDSLLEQYSREYNDIVARRNKQDIDENRLRLLELSVRYIRGESLEEDEIEAVEAFFDEEAKVVDKVEASEEKDSIESTNGEGNQAKNYSGNRKVGIDPNELEWRKSKIEEDLKSIVKEVEESELRRSISSEVVAALNAGSLRTALTKKYYDKMQREYIYYPSVAKSLQSFSLIEEAEKIFRNEISFELSTALCTVASYRMRGNGDEVNENDDFIKEATVNVVLEDMFHQDTVSISDSITANEEKSELGSQIQALSEKQVRTRRIQNDLDSIIKDAEENHICGKIEGEAIDALARAANEIVFIKKYYDVDTDMFKYFPSVKNTILNRSLMERAEDFYLDGVQGFPPDYISALRASASTFRPEFVEVDEEDTYVINMAVDVDIDEKLERKRSEKSREACATNHTSETASMLSFQTAEAPVNDGGSCSKRGEQSIRSTVSDIRSVEDVKMVASKPDNVPEEAEVKPRNRRTSLHERIIEDLRKIKEALVDLETEFVAESNRLDNEAIDCRSKHKVEAERIEKDRRAVEEEAKAEENEMQEKTKKLREELKIATAKLESEREAHAEADVEMGEEEKDQGRGWGWFNKQNNNHSTLAKEKEEKQMEFKLREIELEKDISKIATRLNIAEYKAKDKERNITEWKAELDEEYRHLEALTSATEEKLKEEKRNLKASYEEEKQRLLDQKSVLREEIRGDIGKFLSSDREMHTVTSNTGREGDDSIRSHTSGANDAIVPDHLVLLNQPHDSKDEASLGGHLFDSGGEEEAESDDDSSTTKEVPDHLALLSQPTNTGGDALAMSLNLFDVFDNYDPYSKNHVIKISPPKAKNVPKKKVLAAALKAKHTVKDSRQTDVESKTKNKITATSIPEENTAVSSIPEAIPEENSGATSVTEENANTTPPPEANAAASPSSEETAGSTLKPEENAEGTSTPEENANATVTAEETVDRNPKTPRKSLIEMRRKVDEALEKAMAIRTGDSSRRSRSVPVEEESERSGYPSMLSPSPSTRSRKFSTNPKYPMVREIERLSGFIRRYEKKLETVCKSLLTLASVNEEEKDTLAARELDLPEMLEFVVNQDWYKEHSTDKTPDAPNLIFAKGAKKDEGAGNNKYAITSNGRSFIDLDGPSSDISRFLTYLSKIEDGLSRDDMKAQWKEIAKLSGDEQSQRVCDKLDKLIEFCMHSNMIQT